MKYHYRELVITHKLYELTQSREQKGYKKKRISVMVTMGYEFIMKTVCGFLRL